MMVNKSFVTPDAPHVQALAEGYAMPPILAGAWVEMTLAEPHGVDMVRERLRQIVAAAEHGGDGAAARRYRRAQQTFEGLVSRVGPPVLETVVAQEAVSRVSTLPRAPQPHEGQPLS